MQRRIKPAKLQENYYGTLFPKPTERVVDMSMLDGGLNLWQLSYRMDRNQSPDCLNVYWNDGCLRSRPGQDYIYPGKNPVTGEYLENTYGDFYGCYDRLWHGYVIAHKDTKLYKIDPVTGAHTQIYSGLSTAKGAGFFVFDNKLYYIGGGKFVVVTAAFMATDVEAFVPTVYVGLKPNGEEGSPYQPENRVQAKKTVLFTSDGTSTIYQLPFTNIESTVTAKVNTYDAATQTYSWVTRNDITVDAVNGTVTFDTAPAQDDPVNVNNVEITCAKANTTAANAILGATCLSVYGGDTDLAVVVGGSSAQANAYYWSGNTHLSVDPTYFPVDYYNLAGTDANNKIVAFGRQQGMLIIFQQHSIGKAVFESDSIYNRTYLTLNYTNINSAIGCDVPGSVQLVNNNLVFANSYGGVYVLANTSTADENNVRRISLNINGNGARGLLMENYTAPVVASFDDNERYWLIINGHAYLWDYSIKGYTANEENLTWFYFEGIGAAGVWQDDAGEHYYFDSDGGLVTFTPKVFNDFGTAIERKYVFAVQYFGTYEVLKSVMKIVFAVRSDTRSLLNIHYQSDWEGRDDRTPIDVAPPGIQMLPYDFTLGYNFMSTVYAYSTVRIPRCFHIRHFGMTIFNNEINTDIGVVSAQIFYRYEREIR